MRPRGDQLFKSHGSAEDGEFKLKGGEMRRAMGLIDYKCRLATTIIFAVLSGIAPILMNIFMGGLMTGLVGDDPNRPQMPPEGPTPEYIQQMKDFMLKVVEDMSVRIAYIIAAMTVIQAINFYCRAAIGPVYVKSLRKMIFKSLLDQDIEYFDKTSTGILISRLSEDVTLVRETYIEKLIQIVQMGVQSLAGVALAFYYSWKVTLVVLAALPIVAGIYYLGDYCVERMWMSFNDTSSRAASKAEEVITSFRTVKSFDNELYEADLYSNGLWSIHDVLKKTSLAKAFQNGMMNLVMWGVVGIIIYYSGWLVLFDGLESGSILVLMGCLMMAAMGASQAASLLDDFKKARVAAGKILQICDKVPKVDRYDGEEMKEVVGKIEFRDVKFKYPSRDDYAVDGLSFVINAGETVALVGESGCGKTTTLALLQRFYEIESGEILIDDVDIRKYSPHSLRSHIAVVPQGPVLFSMSVKDNIRFAKPDAEDTVVANAARIGNAHSFISELPNQYDTFVAQTSLSGGQKQRLCISRAIVADTPILMLDEATAALDTESEQLVQQSLEVFRHGKTAIVVAHRLSTVKNADRILVFQNGRVVESGTHDELIKDDGIYAELVKFQLQ